jgi:hypothetical protein
VTVAQLEDDMRWIKLLLMIAFGVFLFNFASRISTPEVDENENQNRSDVQIDSAILLVMESYPMKVSLALRGELPTPCHELVWEVVGPSDKNIIEVTTYAESTPETFCIQLLEPFELNIPLGSFTELGFRVRLNGEEIGDA